MYSAGMSYFSSNYPRFRYPLEDEESPGFREAQLGAIHAIAAHFVTREEPGIVTMPTGAGKTAVLIAAAFVLRAKRVLVITPSKLVREQIAREVKTLSTLKAIGALSGKGKTPSVKAVRHRISSADEWEALREYDVVVGTVPSISPEFEAIPEPPADLFDLVLVDEAHHSPARTWRRVLDHFAAARQVLFTATPFRQDQREIQGRFIFTYELRQAHQDGVFGTISFQPVTPEDGQSNDIAVALAAERQLRDDQSVGLDHRIMVRTDTRKRAEELLELYEQATTLRLRILTGNKSLKYSQRLLDDLSAGALDGIVCVNMLGEGFDFPRLKVAAVHSPHRSLSVTLQFIGRFARTTGERVGAATFLAIPSEIEIETERLYESGAVWQEIIQNLAAGRVDEETRTREVIESFVPKEITAQDLTDLSLYVLEPYFHVKVYQLAEVLDLSQPVEFPSNLEVVFESVSDEHGAAVYIAREITLPRWTTDDRLSIVRPELFIFYQERRTRLLFVCASRRVEGLYEQLVQSFRAADPRPLSLARLNRALNDLETPEFFNIGMRNRVVSNTTESYRIITGSNADKAILKSDGRLYHRGHMFGRASEEGHLVTIGLSSASKIWSNKSAKLPGLIKWCEKLALRIVRDRVPVTGSGIDYLDVGEEIDVLPANIIGVTWPKSIYQSPPSVRFRQHGVMVEEQLTDFDLSVERSTPDAVVVRMASGRGVVYRATFSFATNRFFEPYSEEEPELSVMRDKDGVPVIQFLNDEMLEFYTSDLSLVHGYSLLRAPEPGERVFEEEQVDVADWERANVDITTEVGPCIDGRLSVHQYIEELLRNGGGIVAYYDHGSGEVADFVNVVEEDGGLLVQLYHCKGATGEAVGHRVADVNEIAAQSVRSVRWALKQRIVSTIRRRFNARVGGHRFIRGDLPTLVRLMEETTPAAIAFEVIAVQPGLRRADMPEGIKNNLAASSDHLVRAGFKRLRVLASA